MRIEVSKLRVDKNPCKSGDLLSESPFAFGMPDKVYHTSKILDLQAAPALSDNGDLLVAGVSSLSFVVAELSPSTGSEDTSYNSSGSATIAVNSSGSSLVYVGMAIAPDGDLMLAGAYAASGLTYHAAFVAVTPLGVADSSFGTSGVVVESATLPAAAPGTSPFVINAEGQLLLGDTTTTLGGSGSTTFHVFEYNRDGSPDTSFGSSGQASETISGIRTGLILQLEANGQILVGAAGVTSGSHFVLVRFNADGTLDTTFGTSGVETGASEAGGLAMTTAGNGETITVGTINGSSGIILQEFHTLANSQTLYVEYDADYNVTSLTNSSGGVVERYSYDPYGTVTVLNPTGTVRGDGTIASSDYGWVYTFQGGRIDPVSGLVHFQRRDDNTGLGRWDEQDPDGYVNGPNVYQFELSSPLDYVDPHGEWTVYDPPGFLAGTAFAEWGAIFTAIGLELAPEIGIPIILGAMAVGGPLGSAIGDQLAAGNAGNNNQQVNGNQNAGNNNQQGANNQDLYPNRSMFIKGDQNLDQPPSSSQNGDINISSGNNNITVVIPPGTPTPKITVTGPGGNTITIGPPGTTQPAPPAGQNPGGAPPAAPKKTSPPSQLPPGFPGARPTN
jgi:uncharacterized delta-60 repeat protein/RHS repeat-associated protein